MSGSSCWRARSRWRPPPSGCMRWPRPPCWSRGPTSGFETLVPAGLALSALMAATATVPLHGPDGAAHPPVPVVDLGRARRGRRRGGGGHRHRDGVPRRSTRRDIAERPRARARRGGEPAVRVRRPAAVRAAPGTGRGPHADGRHPRPRPPRRRPRRHADRPYVAGLLVGVAPPDGGRLRRHRLDPPGRAPARVRSRRSPRRPRARRRRSIASAATTAPPWRTSSTPSSPSMASTSTTSGCGTRSTTWSSASSSPTGRAGC